MRSSSHPPVATCEDAVSRVKRSHAPRQLLGLSRQLNCCHSNTAILSPQDGGCRHTSLLCQTGSFASGCDFAICCSALSPGGRATRQFQTSYSGLTSSSATKVVMHVVSGTLCSHLLLGHVGWEGRVPCEAPAASSQTGGKLSPPAVVKEEAR